jgi:hypothetical protein
VVDKKRIIGKNGGLRRRRHKGSMAPQKKYVSYQLILTFLTGRILYKNKSRPMLPCG